MLVFLTFVNKKINVFLLVVSQNISTFAVEKETRSLTIKKFRIMAISNFDELVNGVRNIKGCVFAHIEYTSVEKLPKKLGLGEVTKNVSGQVQLNYDYENAVNNRLEKQGLPRTFSASSLPWGVWDTPNKIIDNKGTLYLRFYCFKNNKLETEYFVDGRPMTADEKKIMDDYKKGLKKGSTKQSNEGLTENQVEPRSVTMSSITALKCGELDYKIAVKVAM